MKKHITEKQRYEISALLQAGQSKSSIAKELKVHFVLPSSLDSIGVCAFYDCHNLTNIKIPSSITMIGEGAFSRCENLTSIDIGGS